MKKLSQIQQLEEQILSPEVRLSESKLNDVLAPGFQEFGVSGRVWSRSEVIRALAQEQPCRYQISNFKVAPLGSEAALATYRLHRFAEAGGLAAVSLRSSIWVHRDGRWQMLFHQGTARP